MRELNECTAEIFRRGEQKIRERKRKRSRVLALCIPICLIAAVCLVMNLPALMQAGNTGERARPEMEMAGNDLWDPACPYTEVEIQNAGSFPEHYGEVTDRPAVAELFGAVNSLFADAGGHDMNTGGSFPAEVIPADEDNAGQAQNESAGTSKGYRIIFTAEDGSQAVYRLSGNILVNVNTNETVFLSDAQTAGLMAALGVSE